MNLRRTYLLHRYSCVRVAILDRFAFQVVLLADRHVLVALLHKALNVLLLVSVSVR